MAKLARLQIADDELDRYASQLSSILGHIDKISRLDIAGVEPTSHVIQLVNVMRADEARDSVSRELALMNGPEVEAGAFRVPPILDVEE